MSAAIEINDISFAYPGYPPCINNLYLTINQGERFGLFGPNGAGKTTLMQLMTGLLTYQKGSIQLLGNEIKKHNKKVNYLFGFVPQDFSFYHELSPKENLSFFGAWAGLTKEQIKDRTLQLLQVLGLDAHSAKPGENCGVVVFPDGLEQAEASNATAASAARLVSLFDAGMSPPVG